MGMRCPKCGAQTMWDQDGPICPRCWVVVSPTLELATVALLRQEAEHDQRRGRRQVRAHGS